jgi:hypothetical protein
MEEDSNYKVDLDELIFAKKNKAYGAYKLRKAYKKYLSIGMWTAIIFFILLTTVPLIYKALVPRGELITYKQKVVQIANLPEPPSIGEKKDNTLKPEKKNIESLKVTESASDAQTNEALDFFNQNADTTSLEQIYNESTLNVSIKYPIGWIFIDQNVDKRLDGVTFWSNTSDYNPPPVIHLEVRDRSLFNESKYKHNLTVDEAVIYFNDPEKLANYFSQTFYFRTESGEDFSLKLTIKGEEAFKSFIPTFYGMLKSFKFGSSWF